jgi:hypothetical protein
MMAPMADICGGVVSRTSVPSACAWPDLWSRGWPHSAASWGQRTALVAGLIAERKADGVARGAKTHPPGLAVRTARRILPGRVTGAI